MTLINQGLTYTPRLSKHAIYKEENALSNFCYAMYGKKEIKRYYS
jgi:hypothetical protein